LVFLLAGCVAQTPTAALRPPTRPLEQQLKAQDKQIQQLNTAFQQLAKTVKANQADLVALRNDIQQLHIDRNTPQQSLAKAGETIKTAAKGSTTTAAQNSPAQPTATELYLSGFSAYTNSNYASAVDNFTTFIQSYPRNPYIANAYYWLGKSCLAQGNLQGATQVFSALIDDYPDAGKAADAQLQLIQVYVQLDQPEQAKMALLKLRQQYPDSTANKNISADLLESLSH